MIDLSKAKFGDRFLNRAGDKMLYLWRAQKLYEKMHYLLQDSWVTIPMPYCEDGYYRWDGQKSQLNMPTEQKHKGSLDIVAEGWDGDTIKALKDDYSKNLLEYIFGKEKLESLAETLKKESF